MQEQRVESGDALFIIGTGGRLPGGVDVDTRVDRLLKQSPGVRVCSQVVAVS